MPIKSKTTYRACPVCDYNKAEHIYSIKMYSDNGILPDGYDIVTCRNCGMCYADTNASQADYDTYYSQCNYYAGVPSIRKEYAALHAQIRDIIKQLASKEAAILDIGFGKGELLTSLRAHGYPKLFGMDPSEYSVEELKKGGIDAYVGNVYDSPAKGAYDVILLTGVLEHLLTPHIAIENIYTMLKPSGLFIAAYPDFSYMKEDAFSIASNFNQEHINYFSGQTADRICSLCGFERVQETSFVAFEAEKSIQYGLLSVYKKTKQEHRFDTLKKLSRDDKTKRAIKEYLNRMLIREQQVAHIIADYARSQEPIVIWGTGQYTLRLLASTQLSDCSISCYIDSNPSKIQTAFAGKIIQSPEYIKFYQGSVFVCSMMYAEDIVKKIKDLNSKIHVVCL